MVTNNYNDINTNAPMETLIDEYSKPHKIQELLKLIEMYTSLAGREKKKLTEMSRQSSPKYAKYMIIATYLTKLYYTVTKNIDFGTVNRIRGVFLIGPPAGSKTYSVLAAAQELSQILNRRIPVKNIRISTLEGTDFAGLPTILKDKNEIIRYLEHKKKVTGIDYDPNNLPPMIATNVLFDNILPDAHADGDAGIVFMDEASAGDPRVLGAAMGLAGEGMLGSYKLPPGYLCVFAANPVSSLGHEHVSSISNALLDRVCLIHMDKINIDDFKEYAVEKKIHPIIIGFLETYPSMLHKIKNNSDADEIQRKTASPRTWEMFNDMAFIGLSSDKTDNMNEDTLHYIFGLSETILGPEVAVLFQSYLKNHEGTLATKNILEYGFEEACKRERKDPEAIKAKYFKTQNKTEISVNGIILSILHSLSYVLAEKRIAYFETTLNNPNNITTVKNQYKTYLTNYISFLFMVSQYVGKEIVLSNIKHFDIMFNNYAMNKIEEMINQTKAEYQMKIHNATSDQKKKEIEQEYKEHIEKIQTLMRLPIREEFKEIEKEYLKKSELIKPKVMEEMSKLKGKHNSDDEKTIYSDIENNFLTDSEKASKKLYVALAKFTEDLHQTTYTYVQTTARYNMSL